MSKRRGVQTVDCSREIAATGPQATVAEAAREMCARGVGCLVVNRAGQVIGIVTERDFLKRVLAHGANPRTKSVEEVMTRTLVSVTPGTPIETAQKILSSHDLRHVPVISGGKAVGMISSRDVMTHQLKKHEAMRAAAEQVAMLSTTLKSLDFEEVVTMATQRVPELFGARRAMLLLPKANQDGTTRVVRHHCLCPSRKIHQWSQAVDPAPSGAVTIEDAPPACQEAGCGASRVLMALDLEAGLNTESACRQVHRGYLCMGALDLSDEEARETLDYKGALIREILGANLSNARLFQEARRQSMTDSLTGVGTRRVFDDKLEAEFARSARYKRPFCVVMLDVDHFKTINDRLGHPAGDKALQELGDCIHTEKRACDLLARYGGDEFVLLLPETTPDAAVDLMERIRRKVREIPMPQNLKITLSCGVAEHEANSDVSPNELIRRADLALYRAKERGRDRIERWSPETSLGEVGVESDKVRRLQGRIAGLALQSKEMVVQSIWGLAQAIEARDPYTKYHSENVMRYAVGIAETLGVSEEEVEVIRRAGMIHDLGKIGVPDDVLRKPGKLTDKERALMEQHPQIAAGILTQMSSLEREIPIVRHHHERWDGDGYPVGLSGTLIPLGARVLGVADAFDAITSNRIYRNARGLDDAVHIIRRESGKQFDPEIVQALLRWIEHVARTLDDPQAVAPKDLLDTQEGCTLAA